MDDPQTLIDLINGLPGRFLATRINRAKFKSEPPRKEYTLPRSDLQKEIRVDEN